MGLIVYVLSSRKEIQMVHKQEITFISDLPLNSTKKQLKDYDKIIKHIKQSKLNIIFMGDFLDNHNYKEVTKG